MSSSNHQVDDSSSKYLSIVSTFVYRANKLYHDIINDLKILSYSSNLAPYLPISQMTSNISSSISSATLQIDEVLHEISKKYDEIIKQAIDVGKNDILQSQWLIDLFFSSGSVAGNNQSVNYMNLKEENQEQINEMKKSYFSTNLSSLMLLLKQSYNYLSYFITSVLQSSSTSLKLTQFQHDLDDFSRSLQKHSSLNATHDENQGFGTLKSDFYEEKVYFSLFQVFEKLYNISTYLSIIQSPDEVVDGDGIVTQVESYVDVLISEIHDFSRDRDSSDAPAYDKNQCIYQLFLNISDYLSCFNASNNDEDGYLLYGLQNTHYDVVLGHTNENLKHQKSQVNKVSDSIVVFIHFL